MNDIRNESYSHINVTPLVSICILKRREGNGLIEPVESAYGGRILAKVWSSVNRLLLKLDARQYFYPLDAMDAYAEAVEKMECAAKSLDPAMLASAKPETYLYGVAKNAFRNFFRERVQPCRREYRALEGLVDGAGGDEETTVQDLGERLPSGQGMMERQAAARMELELIFAELPDLVVRAFTALLVAEYNFVEAAHLCHIAKDRFYRLWPFWIKMAHAVALKGDNQKDENN